MLTLTGPTISDYQTCSRRTVLNRDWKPHRFRPKELFDSCLRMGIFDLSAAKDLQETIDRAVSTFLQCAANPGLDMIGDPFLASKDWVMMLEMCLRAISRLTLLTLKDVPGVQLDPQTRWCPIAHQDDSGTLHRWVTVASWDEDALARELHGWHSFGDIAVTRMPMMLHVIVIGSIRNGRRASTWARGWRHPSINSLRIRFRQSNGHAFNGWRATYLADLKSQEPEEWTEQMWAEGASQALMRHLTINAPSDAVCEDSVRQLLQIGMSIRSLGLGSRVTFTDLPMSRSSCDGILPCHWQHACYSESPVTDLSTLGLYEPRAR